MKHLIIAMALLVASIKVSATEREDAPATLKTERVVYVAGAVTQPGRVLFSQDRVPTILDAISRSGGFTQYADSKRVKLTRKNAVGEAVTTEVNVEEILKARDAAAAPPLESGDSIFIPERKKG